MEQRIFDFIQEISDTDNHIQGWINKSITWQCYLSKFSLYNIQCVNNGEVGLSV